MLLKLELFSILFNHLFMLGGIFLFGWSVTELMLFYWIEPLVSVLLKGYLNIYTPLKIDKNEDTVRRFRLWILFFMVIIILQTAALYAIVLLNAQLPQPMAWTLDWIFLLALMIAMYCMPIYAQKQQGFIPIEENMPLQTKILLSPLQFITTYLILGITLAGLFCTDMVWIWLIFMIGAKMGIEIFMFMKLKQKR